METTLFWIGCGMLGWSVSLRQIIRHDSLLKRRAFTALIHALYIALWGGFIGFVISASVDLNGPSMQRPLIGAMLGFVYAIFQMGGTSKPGRVSELLAGDLEWAETTFSALFLAAIIMYAVLQAFKIPSGSMEDTLHIGDHLFVNKFVYGIRVPYTDRRILRWHDVHRRDVVVFEAPPSAILSQEEREHNVKKDFIKRAIGLPGDEIEIKNKQVYVNGQPQNEPYVVYKDPNIWPEAMRVKSLRPNYQSLWQSGQFYDLRPEEIRDNFGPVTVPAECYFVMGDNRDGSFDSRFWGPMPNRLLKGKAWLVYWPPSWFTHLVAWLGDRIPALGDRLDLRPVPGPVGVRFIR